MKEQDMIEMGYNSDDFENGLNNVIQMIQVMIKTENPHTIVPAVFAEYLSNGETGESAMLIIGMPDVFSEGVDKHEALYNLGHALAQKEYLIYAMFLAAEAWTITRPADGMKAEEIDELVKAEQPSEAADRREIVTIAGRRLDGMQAVTSIPIIRDTEQRIILGEPDIQMDRMDEKRVESTTMGGLFEGYMDGVAAHIAQRKAIRKTSQVRTNGKA